MKINELEKTLNINRANIRYYEKEGLLKPCRKENNYRDYSEDEVFVLKKIIIYRKLGISINDIKNVFNDELSLTNAIENSINSINKELSELSVSAELCNDILSENIDDKSFNTEKYWEEITSYERRGEEFNEFVGIDISNFENKKKIKVSIIICISLFFAGIIYSSLCSRLYIHDNEYYDIPQNEINTFSVIDTIKVDTVNNLVYVCYEKATCVNVYDYFGRFKWAASVPYNESFRGIAYFYLTDDNLIIEYDSNVYIYNSLSGTFIEKTYTNSADFIELCKIEGIRQNRNHDDSIPKDFSYDFYNVYYKQKSIIKKPTSYILTNDVWGLIISAIGALGFFVTIVLSAIKKIRKPYNRIKISKKACFLHRFFLTFCFIALFYSVINIALTILFEKNISIGIFPLAFILIISLIVDDLMEKHFNNDEKIVCGTWRYYSIISFFFSLVACIATALTQ